MLSDNAIDNLMQPIIDRQEQINNYVINTIAQRVKEIGHLLPSDAYKLERLLKSGGDVRKINEELAKITGLNEKAIKKLIRDVAKDSYEDTKPYYDYRHKPFIPFEANVALQNVVKAIEKVTAGTYRNLSDSRMLGFLIRNRKRPKTLKFQNINITYKDIIDEAVQAVQSGTLDYNSAMRRTMKQLNESGVRKLYWESGYTQRLDTAVRRNILDGVRAVNQAVQDEVGKQFGADGKEITVHLNPAPDHEPIQGHQFTNEEYDKLQNTEAFMDYNGKKFDPIERHIGQLNCRHFTYSIILGVMKPNYTQEELNDIIKKNHAGYTLPNGKHLTMYECTQKQRQLETKVRECKDGQMMAKEAGDLDLVKEYQAKITRYTKEYEAFSRACGLSLKKSKMTVSGYRRMRVK